MGDACGMGDIGEIGGVGLMGYMVDKAVMRDMSGMVDNVMGHLGDLLY